MTHLHIYPTYVRSRLCACVIYVLGMDNHPYLKKETISFSTGFGTVLYPEVFSNNWLYFWCFRTACQVGVPYRRMLRRALLSTAFSLLLVLSYLSKLLLGLQSSPQSLSEIANMVFADSTVIQNNVQMSNCLL